MTTSSDVRILEPHECWALARSAPVGRLAVAVGGRPDVFPINFVVDGGTVVFRTAEGTKLTAVVVNSYVAFELDGWDTDAGTAWSVVIKGRAERVNATEDLLDSFALPLYPWHGGRKECLVRIRVDQITGRLFHRVDPDTWRSALTGAPRTPPE
jgi:hypothetical protein